MAMKMTADCRDVVGRQFQQEPVDASDRSVFPAAEELTFQNRRFALGSGIRPSAGQQVFTASELALIGSWEAVFPLGTAGTQGRWRPALRPPHRAGRLEQLLKGVSQPQANRTVGATSTSFDGLSPCLN